MIWAWVKGFRVVEVEPQGGMRAAFVDPTVTVSGRGRGEGGGEAESSDGLRGLVLQHLPETQDTSLSI